MRLSLILFAAFVWLLPEAAIAEIKWEPWRSETFERAAKENKPIFLDVGTEWCSACNWMKAVTYADPKVAKLLSEHFVTITVDAEAEPDIGERYGFWGWPALVIMTPKGEHFGFIRGSRPPTVVIPLLEELIARHKKGELKPRDVRVELVASPATGAIPKIVTTSRALLDRFYDKEHHGWGRPKMPFYDVVQQALWRGAVESDAQQRTNALETIRRTVKLMDPVWGGVFFGARSEDWTGLIHERRSEHQANAISLFAEAHALTGDSQWITRADEVVRALDLLLAAGDGLYYTSQEQSLTPGEGGVTPEAYFAKDDAGRRALGMPPTDTSVYADINARLAIAFALLYEQSRRPGDLKRALAIGHHLLAARHENGWVRQIVKRSSSADRARKVPTDANDHAYLRAQGFVGLAFLRLYRTTGNAAWLDAAISLERAMTATLWTEAHGGGYLASDRTTKLPTNHVIADKPLVDNATAAEFLLRLAAYAKGRLSEADVAAISGRAEKTLRAVSDPQFVNDSNRFIGQYIFALHALRDEFVDVTVVCGDLGAEGCRSLWERALHAAPHPRKLVKLQKPGRYPASEKPSLYVCTSQLCSDPMDAATPDLAGRMSAFMAKLDALAGARLGGG
ncbi:MAG: DUF255 domain-containing protein [Methyloligellaceae bacterium]